MLRHRLFAAFDAAGDAGLVMRVFRFSTFSTLIGKMHLPNRKTPFSGGLPRRGVKHHNRYHYRKIVAASACGEYQISDAAPDEEEEEKRKFYPRAMLYCNIKFPISRCSELV